MTLWINFKTGRNIVHRNTMNNLLVFFIFILLVSHCFLYFARWVYIMYSITAATAAAFITIILSRVTILLTCITSIFSLVIVLATLTWYR